MADNNTNTLDQRPTTASSESGHPRTSLLQSSHKVDDLTTHEGLRQVRCGTPLFTANAGCMLLLWMVGVVYTGAVVRTLERRFGLRSTQMGVVMACGDIVHMSVVVFVGYFGRHGHKPRIMCVMALFAAVGNALMVLPHWLFHNSHATAITDYNISSSEEFCAVSRFNHVTYAADSAAASGCHDDAQTSSVVHPVFYVFVVAQLFVGFGGCGTLVLSFPYIDENAPHAKSALYIGVLMTMFGLGPLIANLLAALTLRLPENIINDGSSTLVPGDARWIGCWWLGYLLVAIAILLTSVPLWFFPASMTGAGRRQSETGDENVVSSTWRQIIEFPRRLFHLLRNTAYLLIVGENVCSAYVIIGIFANVVRYLEIAFFQKASVASVISALASSMAGALGGFLGGVLVSRLNLKPAGAVNVMIISTIAFLIGTVILLCLGCPSVNMAGQFHADEHRFSVRTDCSRHCSCSINRQSYDPVCGSDNRTYFSACFAGCSHLVNETYLDCRCVGETAWNSSWAEMTSSRDVTARAGACVSECWTVVVFAVALFIPTFVRALGHVPGTVVNFRVVDNDERSFALAVNSFVMYLLGFVPAPMLFGALIDSTCRLWEKDSHSSACSSSSRISDGAGSSCLLFDTVQLRWRTYGVALVLQFIQLIFVVLLYFVIRRRRFHDDQLMLPVNYVTSTSPLPPSADGSPAPTFDELNLVEITRDTRTVVDE